MLGTVYLPGPSLGLRPLAGLFYAATMTAKKDAYRLELHALHHRKYEFFTEGPPGRCFYCGDDMAPDEDHCPPLTAVDTFGSEYFRARGIPLVRLRCCRNCNGRLGAKHLFTAVERAQYLLKVLEKAHDKEHVMWPAEELQELNEISLRPGAKQKADKAGLLLARVRHLQTLLVEEDRMPVFAEPLRREEEDEKPRPIYRPPAAPTTTRERPPPAPGAKKRGRPRKHADLAARQKAWRDSNDVRKVALDGSLGPTIERLAALFSTTQTEVINHLLRYALTNRNWAAQGLTGWNKVDRRFATGKRPVATLKDDAAGVPEQDYVTHN